MPSGDNQSDKSASSLAAQRRRAAEEHLSEFEALASLMLDLHGVDVVRARLGRDQALRLIRLAGRDAERIAGDWERSEPMRRQVSVGRGWSRDPDHDRRVTRLMLNGAPFSEINRVRAEVAAEYAAKPPASIGPPGSYKDEAPDSGGELGVSYRTVRGPDGLPKRVPVQRSIDYKSWEQLHAEDPAAVVNGLMPGLSQPAPTVNGSHPGAAVTEAEARGRYWAGAPAGSVTECSHEAQDGHKFCTACGAPRSPVTECSHEAQDGHKFCTACGKPLQAVAAVTTEGNV